MTGQLQLTFNGGVADTVFAKLDYSPEIPAEYQDRDLVCTQLLNQFD